MGGIILIFHMVVWLTQSLLEEKIIKLTKDLLA